MPTASQALRLLLATTSVLIATSATAFNPNEGAEDPAIYRPKPRLPASVVPHRYYSAPAAVNITPQPMPAITYAPAPTQQIAAAPVPAPAIIAPAPDLRYTPTEQPIQYAPPVEYAAQTAPAPVHYEQPAPQYQYQPQPAPTAQPYYQPQQTNTRGNNSFTLGVEAYYDEYQEDSVNLTDSGIFGSITGGYTHYFNDQWYGMLDLRYSRGSTDYESNSGTIDDITQWETENRLLAGYDFPARSDGSRLKAYFGLGQRYFSDELKGKVATGGGLGYDRRIFQLYIPLGLTYAFESYGLTFAPNLEVAPVVYGNVSSRLGTIPGYRNIENEQTEGFGIRTELMMGQINDRGTGWQAGPFIRYWDMPDSKVDGGFIEPENSRLQIGAAFKLLF